MERSKRSYCTGFSLTVLKLIIMLILLFSVVDCTRYVCPNSMKIILVTNTERLCQSTFLHRFEIIFAFIFMIVAGFLFSVLHRERFVCYEVVVLKTALVDDI